MKILKALPLFSALREALSESYTKNKFFGDVQAGLVVGVVAIPLGMALSIAVGLPPHYGLYTVIVAGSLVALLGGSRYQITGPTAAFVVLLLPVVQNYGLAGLLVAGWIAGLIQLIVGLVGLGRIISYVPHPVTTGFTSGIALVIAGFQLKDFLGISLPKASSGFLEGLVNIFRNFHSAQLADAAVGFCTLGIIVLCVRFLKKTPAPILALAVVTPVVYFLNRYFPDLSIKTILTQFQFERDGQIFFGIPQELPFFELPWLRGEQKFSLDLVHIREILPASFTIAALGAIESLLSALVADGMTEKKHNPNAELIGLGIGNMICPFFGGIPATGAIARTSTSIRFGASSPIAALVHALTALLAIAFFSSLISLIPMASLAALLLFVAWNMSEKEHFFNILKHANWEDKFVLLTCFGLTVIFDMTIGVGVGVILACLLFIRRTLHWTEVEELSPGSNAQGVDLPSSFFVYRISGPLFFGVAYRAIESILNISNDVRIVILNLTKVHWIDSTGQLALDSSLQKLIRHHLQVYIVVDDSEIQKQIQNLQTIQGSKNIFIFPTETQAISAGKEFLLSRQSR